MDRCEGRKQYGTVERSSGCFQSKLACEAILPEFQWMDNYHKLRRLPQHGTSPSQPCLLLPMLLSKKLAAPKSNIYPENAGDRTW
ncbi:hypothetical protein ANCDUO_12902 [Ancylostoma duodenale]|uniref:Uncharacterized protein n=1 Tax=Ancylostoma duodenale TaxID=51022 RepID=A0A0C2CKC3_9BILA|nr:hypothetical protein ANCDUO_12902 [Ancylostoma duodenale]